MGAVRLLAGLELRRRWLSLAAVALTVALVFGAVVCAVAGARRTSTSIERFRDWAHASSGSFQTGSLEEARSLRHLLANRSDVAAFAQRRLVNGFVEDRPISDIALVTDAEGRYGVDVDRPRLLEGRMPAADRPDEVVLNELAARLGAVHVGDVLKLKTWSEQDLYDLFAERFPGFNGPRVNIRVVGIVRTLDGLPGDVARTSPYGIASPAFLSAHRAIGAWPPAIYVRTESEAAFEKLSAAVDSTRVSGVNGPPYPNGDGTYAAGNSVRTAYLDASQKAANSASWALLVFALAAAIVGAIVIGQAILRHLSGSAPSEYLAYLGLTRRRIAEASTAPLLVATIAGIFVGSVVAVLASPMLPIGLARRAEISPGIRVDPLIHLGCAVVAVGLIGAFAFASSLRASGKLRGERRSRRAATSAVATTPVLDTGLRFAVERRAGRRTIPVRTAFAGLAVAAVGIAAAGVVSTSFTRLADEPARWGWNWSSEPDYFGDDELATLAKQLVKDDRVAGVGELSTNGVLVNGKETSAWALESLKGDVAMTLRRGRLPTGSDEVALGEDTLRRTKTHIGERVQVRSSSTTVREFAVVGTVVFRAQSENPVVDDGAAFSSNGFTSLMKGVGDVSTSVELRYPPGADVHAVESALAKDYGLAFNAFTTPQVPGVIRNMSETRTVATALALFFATLGTLALAHALVVGTRRRRLELAVLRTLGFRPSQVRGTIFVQATALGLAAVAVGIPAGIALGRFIWHVMTTGLGALDAPATPWIVLLAAIPATVVWAALLAAVPAWRASRVPVADALRVE